MDENREEKLQIPDLSGLSPLFPGRQLATIIGAVRMPDQVSLLTLNWLVRLIDKTVAEYELGRAMHIRYVRRDGQEDHFVLYARACDHFETCVATLHRATNFLEQLRRRGLRTSDGVLLVPRPRDFSLLADSTRSQLRNFRHAIEHFEEHLLNAKLPSDAPAEVHVSWTGLRLGENEISYTDLASWIQQIYELARPLCIVRITATNPADDPSYEPEV